MARFGRTYVKLGLVRPVVQGASTFNESPTDTEGLADALSTTEAFAETIADTEGIADSLSLLQTEVITQVDALGLADGLTTGQSVPVSFADREGLTDFLVLANIIAPIGQSDLVGLQDILGIVQGASSTIPDRMGLSDSFTLTNPNEVDFFDALTTSDNVITALSTSTTVSDTEGTTDLISITLGYWEGAHVPHSSAGFGEIYIDRCFLVEKEKATESNDGKLSIAGQESSPPTTVALVTFLHGQVVGLQEGKVVPVIFRDKSERNAYYTIGSSSSDLTDYQSGIYGDATVATADWTIELTRAGSDSEVDLQSRLTGAVRLNDFSLTGQKWHAPAVGHYAYYTGSTNPTTLSRTTSDGAMTVYLGIPDNVSPKWGCAVADYHKGRVRIFDTREVIIENEVEGLNRNISASGWSLMNGLVNISPTATAGVLNIANYNGTSFCDKYVNITVGGSNIAQWSAATILRNDFEQCIIRLIAGQTTAGRTTLDLTLKRGSRCVEGYLQNSSSSTLGLSLVTPETNVNTAASGYLTATGDDVNGTRFVCGSGRTFTGSTNGTMTKSSATFMDFFFGTVVSQPNLAVNSTFESGVSGWTTTNATITQSNVQVKNGSWSGLVTSTAGSSPRAQTTPNVAVTAGLSYRASGWLYAPSAIASGVALGINWYNASNVYISTSMTSAAPAIGTWFFTDNSFTAPSGAAFANVTMWISGSPGAGVLLYGDDIRLSASIPSGDAALDFRNQYIGSMPEIVYAVRR